MPVCVICVIHSRFMHKMYSAGNELLTILLVDTLLSNSRYNKKWWLLTTLSGFRLLSMWHSQHAEHHGHHRKDDGEEDTHLEFLFIRKETEDKRY